MLHAPSCLATACNVKHPKKTSRGCRPFGVGLWRGRQNTKCAFQARTNRSARALLDLGTTDHFAVFCADWRALQIEPHRVGQAPRAYLMCTSSVRAVVQLQLEPMDTSFLPGQRSRAVCHHGAIHLHPKRKRWPAVVRSRAPAIQHRCSSTWRGDVKVRRVDVSFGLIPGLWSWPWPWGCRCWYRATICIASRWVGVATPWEPHFI